MKDDFELHLTFEDVAEPINMPAVSVNQFSMIEIFGNSDKN